jgi:hypothetical protein
MAIGDVRGIPNQYVLILDGEDHSAETTGAMLGRSGKSSQTFAEYRAGGAKCLRATVLQNFTTGSVWTLANTASAIGTNVTGMFLPQGSAAGRPKFTVTATISAPTSDDYVGGDGGEATADNPTIEIEWQLAADWAQSTI